MQVANCLFGDFLPSSQHSEFLCIFSVSPTQELSVRSFVSRCLSFRFCLSLVTSHHVSIALTECPVVSLLCRKLIARSQGLFFGHVLFQLIHFSCSLISQLFDRGCFPLLCSSSLVGRGFPDSRQLLVKRLQLRGGSRFSLPDHPGHFSLSLLGVFLHLPPQVVTLGLQLQLRFLSETLYFSVFFS
jgi:hypothetical protein